MDNLTLPGTTPVAKVTLTALILPEKRLLAFEIEARDPLGALVAAESCPAGATTPRALVKDMLERWADLVCQHAEPF